jgi:hypothetical protein
MVLEERPIIGRRYMHYKGGVYRVEGFARHADTGDEVVIYTSTTAARWVRSLRDWNTTVEVNGITMRRFAPIEDEG